MITRNLKRWLALPLLLGAILYACQSEDSPDMDTKQPVEPLTVAMAQSLYQQYVGTTAYLKNDDGSDNFKLIPDWDEGQLFSDSNWYVVESPLELGEDMKITFMTPNTEEYKKRNPEEQMTQILRLVVMRNKETGDNYAFIIVVMPNADYMKSKRQELETNNYLSRNSDLDGMVVYYTTDGKFINGWKYSNGHITHSIGDDNKRLTKVSISESCWYWIVQAGKSTVVHYECERVYIFDDNSIWHDDNSSGGGVSLDFPPLSSNGSNNSTTPQTKDKEPEARTDCPPSAAVNASNAESAMKANADIISKMSTLRNYASSKSNEYGVLINMSGSSYSANTIKGGTSGQVSIPVEYNTVLTVHTHHKSNQGEIFKGPSITDIRNVIVGSMNSYYYKGSVIFAYDGTEYLIYVEDTQKAQDTYDYNMGWFETNSNGLFREQGAQQTYNDAYKNLSEQGYSPDHAHVYSLSNLLDYLDSGIKISIKNGTASSFKEIKAETIPLTNNTYKYKPVICK